MNCERVIRAIAMMSVLGIIGLLPKNADAQCAVSYNDAYTDGTSVFAWANTSDYYNQSPCNPGWSNFTHYYNVSVSVQSPSGRIASDSGSSSAYNGGGSTGASTSLDISGEVGDFFTSTSASIACSVAGSIYYASASQAVTNCGDERTLIIQEYRQYPADFVPACSDFTQTRGSVYFPFPQLNTGDYSWALVRKPLIVPTSSMYGLDNWRDVYGASRIMNSAYRNPAHNYNLPGGPGAANSRHMHGDAADLRNQSGGVAEWNAMVGDAYSANADFIEPSNGPCMMACTHADWRYHDLPGGYQ
jgi:hypothetical protein